MLIYSFFNCCSVLLSRSPLKYFSRTWSKTDSGFATQKNKRKEKKERKAKHDAKILVQDKAKREAGKIALKMIKVTRQAVKDFKKLPSSEKKGFIDFSDQGIAIKKEFLKLKKEMVGFWAKN